VKYKPEDTTFFCDKHPGREAFTELVLSSWYGSVYDLYVVKVHLCDECVGQMYEHLNKEFKAVPKEIEI